MRAQKGQSDFGFGCDRTKIPDLIHDILPGILFFIL